MKFKKEKNYSDLSRFIRDPNDNKISEKTNVLIIWKSWSWKTMLLRDILLEKTDTKKFIIELQDQKFDSFWSIVKESKNNAQIYRINLKKEEYLNDLINFLNIVKNTSWDKIVIMDEFHLFFKNKDLKNEINLLLREARNNNISVIIATQEQEEKLVECWIVNHFSEIIRLENIYRQS